MPKKNLTEPDKPFRFIHCADAHLGYKQYGLEERVGDFFNAFDEVISYAIKNDIENIIIAGDLFHKKDLNPNTLKRTEEKLNRAKGRDIKVTVIEGNHDSKHYINKMSWLEYLDHLGLISLLPAGDKLVCYNLGDISHVSMCNVWGGKYQGASISKFLDQTYEDVLKSTHKKDGFVWEGSYNILMLHCGVIGMLPHTGSVNPDSLMRFKNPFDYVALGHIHKPGEIENFIFNPGSLENCSIAESEYQGGFYDVTLSSKGVDAKHIPTTTRPVVRLRVDTSINFSMNEVPWAEFLKGYTKPIVEVSVYGVSENRVKPEHIPDIGALYVKVKDFTTRPSEQIEFKGNDPKDVEHQVVESFTGDKKLTALLLSLKGIEDEDPEITYSKFEGLVN